MHESTDWHKVQRDFFRRNAALVTANTDHTRIGE